VLESYVDRFESGENRKNIAMSTEFYRESAKIYQFPVRSLATAASRRNQVKSGRDLRMPEVTATDFGSGWYHDAAIQDNYRNPKA
jgi:Protein of unknown function (DUF2735)